MRAINLFSDLATVQATRKPSLSGGGTLLLKSKVEFTRLAQEGKVDQRVFSYNPNAASTSYNHPILMAGDIVLVRDSAVSAGIGLLSPVSTPFVGV